MLQRLDICFSLIGKVVESQQGIDAAIAFADEKLALFHYLDSNPLLGVKLDLGVRYLQKNLPEQARGYLISLIETPVVQTTDEGWEAGVRERARGALQTATEEMATQSGAQAATEKKCFIATAAYGSEDCTEVNILREFRNQHLLKSHIGRKLVSAYYALSPFLADRINASPIQKRLARKLVLDVLVRFAGHRLGPTSKFGNDRSA
jgi:hypothetical protein